MNSNLSAMLAIGAGVCLAMQAAANTRLRGVLQAPGVWASYFSIIGTILFSSLAMLILRPVAPTWENIRNSDWWNWIGGPLGALIVLAGTILVQHLGAAVFIALLVSGQLISSLLMDHFGLMGLPVVYITWKKSIGALLVLLGVLAMKYW